MTTLAQEVRVKTRNDFVVKMNRSPRFRSRAVIGAIYRRQGGTRLCENPAALQGMSGTHIRHLMPVRDSGTTDAPGVHVFNRS
ncbi:hypothetical protein [Bradyrhizobium sp. dw_78]|uniref:hypothetical protein n=1 Tax=Bradyrhizobium sp. dw_78 TaxID=2719793 RepID=UPI001BD6A961|nr:hypothetical protein [Bradyrhizobium sp. dw_78]